jgi:hypothetical protein
MDIQEINRDIIAYLGQMIKDNRKYDIRNMSEEEFDDMKHIYLNDWERGCDIITEYYGNTTTFIPSLEGFIEMTNVIYESRDDYQVCKNSLWGVLAFRPMDWGNPRLMDGNYVPQRNDNIHTYANTLRHYAYHYIDNLGYDGFTEELNEWIQENIIDEEDDEDDEDNFDYENSCDCCVKSWTDTANEFGVCNCICKCGDELRYCRYKCYE